MIFTPPARNAFRLALKNQDPVALGFVNASRNLLARQSADPERLPGADCFGAMCLLYLAGECSADELLSAFEAVALRPKENLGQALWAKIGAMIYDCLEDGITDSQKHRLQAVQRELINALLTVSHDNPHVVTNNWWGITHAGIVLAALCLPPSTDRDHILTFASHRLRAFLHHFGPACVYHEGLGYQDYTLSQVLPALYAMEAQQLFSFAQDFPQSKRLAHSLLLASADIPALQNQPGKTSRHGGYLSWNDAGHEWPGSNVAGLSIHLSDQAPALWSWFLKLAGPDSPGQDFAPGRGGLYYNAMLYPYGQTVAAPSELPTYALDTRQGMLLYRNQWRNADDLVIGIYARSTHVGGHSQDDAGSIRVIGMGYDWILGGGQNRPQAEWQSVAVPRGTDEKKRTECGAILYEEINPSFFTLGLELRRARGAYCERYVSFFNAPNDQLAGALLMLDHIDEHRDLPWSFHLTLSPQHRIQKHENGITLVAPDNSCMHLHFFTPPDDVTITGLPDAARTFSSGRNESYLRFPVLNAHYNPRKHRSIYTLITFSKTGHQPVICQHEGLAFSLDGHRIASPFSAAVSPRFVLNESKGLCQDPLYALPLPS